MRKWNSYTMGPEAHGSFDAIGAGVVWTRAAKGAQKNEQNTRIRLVHFGFRASVGQMSGHRFHYLQKIIIK